MTNPLDTTPDPVDASLLATDGGALLPGEIRADAALPDGQLIERTLSGDANCFNELVFRYRRALLRVAESRLGRPDWAEDAVQESFLCAFRSLRSYDSRFSFRTWLWTILLNQCRRIYGRKARDSQVQNWSDRANVGDQESSIETSRDVICPQSAPLSQLMDRERSQRLEQSLAELPEAQADALRLRFFGGLKFHEIAQAMGCSLASAKNRVRWGLLKMAARTKEEC